MNDAKELFYAPKPATIGPLADGGQLDGNH